MMRFCAHGLALLLLHLAIGTPAVAGDDAAAAPVEHGRYILKLRGTAQDPGRARRHSAPRGRVDALGQRNRLALGQRSLAPDLAAIEISRSAADPDLDTLVQRLREDPDVEFIEVDYRRNVHALPADPQFSEQWYLRGVEAAAIDAELAWDTSIASSDTVIAVLDTGINFVHPDLGKVGETPGGRMLPGLDFVSADAGGTFNAANDGDGWDSDAEDPGDWIDASDRLKPGFSSCQVAASSWHGTRVAGIIGAITGNGTGIAGGTWEARILPVRVLGKCGGLDSDIIAGARWAAGLAVPNAPANPTPARILNLSLGSPDPCSRAYQDLMTDLTAAGVVVLSSAGNDIGPVHAPARCAGVLAVAGVRQVGTKVGYSSYGSEVGISAPAGNCVNLSGFPCVFEITTTTMTGSTVPTGSAYTSQSNPNYGTSFSAPIVAAIAGLMYGVNDQLTPAELIARIRAAAHPFPADPDLPTCPATESSGQCNCTTSTCGAGLADAPAAVSEALRPIARIAAPANYAAGEAIVLDGSGSAAARGVSIGTYDWQVVSGDDPFVGATSLDSAAVNAPPAGGNVTLSLTVTDTLGRQDSTQVTLSTAATGGGGGGAIDSALLLGLAAAWCRLRARTGQR
jgi:serine protease